MPKKHTPKRTLDTIMMELLPKIVDTVPEREKLRNTQTYWRYATGQIMEFLGRLPSEYTSGISIQKYRKEKAARYTFEDSSIEFMIGFKPTYYLPSIPPGSKQTTYTRKHMVACPNYDLAFKLVSREAAATMVQAALQQFHILMGDDTGPLMVYRTKGERIIRKDVQLLADYLPKGTIIQARCNSGASNGKAEYRI